MLVDIIPCAEMVKFAKNGSTVTTAAVKLARAYTGRDCVAFCKDHPFFSYDDWFIGTTDCAAGVPAAISDLSLPFRYNDLDSLRALRGTWQPNRLRHHGSGNDRAAGGRFSGRRPGTVPRTRRGFHP